MALFKVFYPDYTFSSVTELTVDKLRELGLTALLLDVDCTLKAYRAPSPSPEVVAWLESVKAAGIGLCIISNGRGRRIAALADTLGLPYIAPAMKPCARGCRKAITAHGFAPDKTAIVGDQIFADIWAGHRAGITAILVTPIHPEQEPWFARMKRPLERLVFRLLKG